ncbi:hypothetical protein GCM10008018_65190 [Paenibacillus marchantiophytorum]|uniref:DUF2334 domain-containing protein n=1 Tax=Paenibacillus marchantiophytorum TaxID=1619310 RepID=A0ABQ1FGE5_9BACL|nr:hypothetical protein [Paenibacillus marchantiophytorum]GGA10885.1 hypothetical protein GCM10008018_65190 [Paenibacillus marchantiophytorum]
MQNRRIFLLGLLLMIVLAGLPYSKADAANTPKPDSVLLLYDSAAISTPKEGNVEALERLLASFGTQVTVHSYDQYQAGMLMNYTKVISVRNADDLFQIPDSYKQDLGNYQGDFLHIGNQVPMNVQQALGLDEQNVEQDIASLKIGQLSQKAIMVNGISYVTKYTGKAYGSLTSDKLKSAAPYAVSNGKYGYIPYMVKGNLTELAAAYLLRDWLSVKSNHQLYLLLDEIYPFSNLALLDELADRLYEAGIPFIANVQPVLSNLDYPAAQRYLETLKHVQSRNGSIVVNAPVVASTISQDITVLKSEMSSFLDALAGYGIVPLGIGSEMYWTYDDHYAVNGLSYFDSSILFPNEHVMYRARTDKSQAFGSSVYTIPADVLKSYVAQGQILEPLPMDAALVYAFPDNNKKLDTLMSSLIQDWTLFSDYKYEDHTVRTQVNEMGSGKGQLHINGQTILLNSVLKDISADHAYVQEGKKSLTNLFSVQNKVFIILIASTLLIFSAFLFIGYRLYKRKYTHTGRQL